MSITITTGLLKPDCVRRRLVLDIYRDIAYHRFTIEEHKVVSLKEADVAFLYGHKKNFSWYPILVEYMTSGSSIAFIAKRRDGKSAIEEMRKLVGYYLPEQAQEGTLRERYWNGKRSKIGGNVENVIHSPENVKEARKELSHFFPEYYETYVGLLL